MKNSFVQQFSPNIKFKYSCFDRVILRGYIRWMFFRAGVVKFLRLMEFRKLSNGVMRLAMTGYKLCKGLNQSFYLVTQEGFSCLWLEICSDNFFKNPMISRTIKNDVRQFAAQPSQIEEAYDSIHRGLSKLTQQLAINS